MIRIARSSASTSHTSRRASTAACGLAFVIALGVAPAFATGTPRPAVIDGAAASVQTKSAEEPTVTTGSVDVDPSFAQRMTECMAVWEARTHMTKSQWRRSCKTTLKSLAD